MGFSFGYGFKRRSYFFIRKGATFSVPNGRAASCCCFFVVVAMLLANIPATAEFYHALLEAPVGITVGSFRFGFDLERFVNDGLMMVFFFTVGLEIKREVVSGHLSTFRQAILPVAGALGGMVVPAVIYLLFNHGTQYAAGWGIPMATDIAFAIAIMSTVGNRVPVSLKVFLTALAVVDDLGAIVVIAVFYGASVNFKLLLAAAVFLFFAWLLNKLKVSSFLPYVLISVALWLLFLPFGRTCDNRRCTARHVHPFSAQIQQEVFPEQGTVFHGRLCQQGPGCARYRERSTDARPAQNRRHRRRFGQPVAALRTPAGTVGELLHPAAFRSGQCGGADNLRR